MIAAMMAAARRTIVLADSSKLGKDSFAQIAGLNAMQILVTDAEPSEDLAAALRMLVRSWSWRHDRLTLGGYELAISSRYR